MSPDEFLADLIPPNFFQDIQGQKAAVLKNTSADRFIKFGWNELNQIMRSQRLSSPRFRLVHESPEITHSRPYNAEIGRRGIEITRVNVMRLHEFLRAGATLIIDAIDETDDTLQSIATAFARRFGSLPQTNLYVSFRDKRGFGLHWDDHDVFVIQLDGFKEWRVYAPTRKFPLFRDAEPNDQKPSDELLYLERKLVPGDVLYVPRGHWHDVVGVGTGSMHLTVGITHPTPLDVLRWVADRLAGFQEMRMDLLVEDQDTDYLSQLEEVIRERVADMLSSGFLSDFAKYRRGNLKYVGDPCLPFGVEQNLLTKFDFIVEWTLAGSVQILDTGEVLICGGGKEMTLSRQAANAINHIKTSHRLTKAEYLSALPESIPTEQAEQLLNSLCELGACSIRDIKPVV